MKWLLGMIVKKTSLSHYTHRHTHTHTQTHTYIHVKRMSKVIAITV